MTTPKTKRRTVALSGITPAAGTAVAYSRAARKYTREMIQAVAKEVLDFYRKYKSDFAFDGSAGVGLDANIPAAIEKLFADATVRYIAERSDEAQDFVRSMVVSAVGRSKKTIAASLKKAIADVPMLSNVVDTSFAFALEGSIATTPSVQNVIDLAITENVNLIEDVPAEYLDKVKESLYRTMTDGGSIDSLAKDISHYGEISLRRANNIANDQARKVFTSVTARQMNDAGVKKFKWIHVGGTVHPRKLHIDAYPKGLNGGVFDYDDPPIIDGSGTRGYPSTLPNCRCIMLPVIEWDE